MKKHLALLPLFLLSCACLFAYSFKIEDLPNGDRRVTYLDVCTSLQESASRDAQRMSNLADERIESFVNHAEALEDYTLYDSKMEIRVTYVEITHDDLRVPEEFQVLRKSTSVVQEVNWELTFSLDE